MLTRIQSAAILGIDSTLIWVEVDAQPGLPREQIVGLPNAVVRESKDRVKSAIQNGGFEYPPRSYTINLAPAEVRKEGALFDLPIAYGILRSTQQINWDFDGVIVGELSLNGQLTGIRGILSICLLCKEKGIQRLMLPAENLTEAQLIPGIELFAIHHISNLTQPMTPHQGHTLPNFISQASTTGSQNTPKFPNFSDIYGQYKARRAAEIAATGWHNMLLIGPPGCGKTMIAQRIGGILPPPTEYESLEIIKVSSVLGKKWHAHELPPPRPFRAPHHTISYGGMVGGGSIPKPGEITRAHRGVLFLDEFAEFPRPLIEILRQPIEDQVLTVSRAHAQLDFPADFLLIAATNPCPCGYFYGGNDTACHCSPERRRQYWNKISGPILDRFDIIVQLSALSKSDLIQNHTIAHAGESSETIRDRVCCAVQFHQARKQSVFNGRLSVGQVKKWVNIEPEATQYIGNAIQNGRLSARSYIKTLKVARTIADLNYSETVTTDHVLEAMQFRSLVE